jgi:hypothetical protein
MTRRHIVGLLAAFAAVVVIGVIAAWQLAEDDPTRRIAIYAAVVATLGSFFTALKNGYDFWEKVQERKKKADESAEKIVAKPLYNVMMIAQRTPGVELYNAGKIPVPIKRVSFCIEIDGKPRRWLMHTRGGLETRYDIEGRPSQDRQYEESARLEPGDPAIEFYMQFMPDRMGLKQLMELPPDRLCILVESNQGVVAEVKGDEIQAYIKRYFRPAKSEPPAN